MGQDAAVALSREVLPTLAAAFIASAQETGLEQQPIVLRRSAVRHATDPATSGCLFGLFGWMYVADRAVSEIQAADTTETVYGWPICYLHTWHSVTNPHTGATAVQEVGEWWYLTPAGEFRRYEDGPTGSWPQEFYQKLSKSVLGPDTQKLLPADEGRAVLERLFDAAATGQPQAFVSRSW